MSRQLINEYFNEIDRLRKFSGTTTENVIRGAFRDLLKSWARQKNLHFLDEYEFESNQRTRIRPDGTIKHDLRLDLGYWEAKDTDDDLDVEIDKKLRRGYPQTNIIFENSDRAVLIQNREQVLSCSMTDGEALLRLLNLFFGYQRQEILDFRKAVEQFQYDLPAVLEALRGKINAAYDDNVDFGAAAAAFLDHAKETINRTLTDADVREMLIQHILTEEIFTHVFNEGDFHRENNIAKQLYALEGKFFTGATKRETLKGLEAYYATIRSTAALINDHGEKQKFLKAIYEGFYRVYNPKAADRLGVVYTPNEIVKFMIEGADWLTQKHFGKALIDRNVEILDPATGTGTFICELLDYFRGQPQKLAHKYKEELHANEVAILPYYVANLNIEATYAAITGQYTEFPSLCFVDTLDNVSGLGIKRGHQHDLFAGLSEENIERVKRQNRRKISVVIGNPPYNANQQNENDNNKNRAYKHIDAAIKSTYIAQSTAQKTKLYDMYARFFRWASDRLGDEGVLAFITNRSFVDSRTFDGFRKVVADEFAEIYVVDLGGDVRANPKLSGTRHNVFGIQTGVAISFFVKKGKKADGRVFYARRPEMDTADEKLAFLAANPAAQLSFQRVEPDKKHNWINLTENDWHDLIPVAEKETKATKWPSRERAIFKLFSNGLVTARDEWISSFSALEAAVKTNRLLAVFSSEQERWRLRKSAQTELSDFVDREIKWTGELEAHLKRGTQKNYDVSYVVKQAYRPFIQNFLYYDTVLVHRTYQQLDIFPTRNQAKNVAIGFSGISSSKLFQSLAVNLVPSFDLLEKTQFLPRYRYTDTGERIDNITSWAENKFIARYGKSVTKDDIFAYVYAVLHDPIYREKYAINLKREFPRIPFYPDFHQWVEWGQNLLDLHIGYESVAPWPLKRIEKPDEKAREAGLAPKALLKADRDNNTIRLDSETVLSGLPPEVWNYKLGNRSGVEWVLDQYKEKTPKDPTIREKFNTYRFADYKEKVIDLIGRVTRVSIETMAVAEEMKKARRD
jgi:predicted helicase